MGCMPYGHLTGTNLTGANLAGFNPSYGLHALRANVGDSLAKLAVVSIPHMGCMPYGQRLHFP